MTRKIEDGGPAFPVAEDHKVAADIDWTCGMTLRDYFASKAPLHDLKFESTDAAAKYARMPIPTTTEELVDVAMTCAAKASYAYADAMLKERAK